MWGQAKPIAKQIMRWKRKTTGLQALNEQLATEDEVRTSRYSRPGLNSSFGKSQISLVQSEQVYGIVGDSLISGAM
jgi:hypothetical protein